MDAENTHFQQNSRLFGPKSRLFGRKVGFSARKKGFPAEKVHFQRPFFILGFSRLKDSRLLGT
jgi:hypothetical protein